MKKRRGIPCLLVAALLLFAACSRPGEAETEARLGDFASPEVKSVAFSVYEGGVCEIEIRTEESDAGDWDYHEIAFPEESDLSAIEKMTALEEAVLFFAPADLGRDGESLRKITERFLSLSSVRILMIEYAPFDLGRLEIPLPEETHLVKCGLQSTVDLTGVRKLYLTDTAWGKDSFRGTEKVSFLSLDQRSVPESLSALSAFPGITRLMLPAGEDGYAGEWPVELSAEHPEIPAGILLPFSEEELRAFLEANPDLTVVLRRSDGLPASDRP